MSTSVAPATSGPHNKVVVSSPIIDAASMPSKGCIIISGGVGERGTNQQSLEIQSMTKHRFPFICVEIGAGKSSLLLTFSDELAVIDDQDKCTFVH